MMICHCRMLILMHTHNSCGWLTVLRYIHHFAALPASHL